MFKRARFLLFLIIVSPNSVLWNDCTLPIIPTFKERLCFSYFLMQRYKLFLNLPNIFHSFLRLSLISFVSSC